LFLAGTLETTPWSLLTVGPALSHREASDLRRPVCCRWRRRVAGPDKADNDQPENPKIPRIGAERQQAQDYECDNGRDDPAGDPGSSERGFVFLLEILGQLLDLERRFLSAVSCRFHALTPRPARYGVESVDDPVGQ
jgi:hypothetical protein